ncbi:hypothetical protein CEXT_33011 [Caerostris extrusa]|uniref:Uncharacterized protein n=1 Tax=Caerostris extrusa TaxID=172846 RepID=A0AAV4VUJ8_CAEEX|nr:hypothetical protein CEXT_33011 [Caerostris extrusa]
MELTKRGDLRIVFLELTKRETSGLLFLWNSRNVRTSGLFSMELTKRGTSGLFFLWNSRNVRTSGLFSMELTKREDLRIVFYGTRET